MGTGEIQIANFSLVTVKLIKSYMLGFVAMGRNTKRMHNFDNYLLNNVIVYYSYI